MTSENENLINVAFTCPMCGIEHYIYKIPESLVDRVMNRKQTGEHIQDILANYSATDREKFLTCYCEECQKMIFGED